MESPEVLRRQIESAQELHSIVGTMKSMAAVHIRQCEEAVASLGGYARAVEMGLQVALWEWQQTAFAVSGSGGRQGAVVLGSDQGMVGQFNQRIAEYVASWLEEHGERTGETQLIAVGVRVAAHLDQAGLRTVDRQGGAGSITGITARVQDLLPQIEAWRGQEGIGRILLFYNQRESGAAYRPVTHQLLPLDEDWLRDIQAREWPSRVLPTFTMERRRLFAALVREHLFVSLYRAFAESMASENASRLAAMQVAQQNIEERLEELSLRYHQLRQASITGELLDILAGFEALSESGRRKAESEKQDN